MCQCCRYQQKSILRFATVISISKSVAVTRKPIIAIAKLLLAAIYYILKSDKNYNVELYRKSDILPVDREITVEQAIIIAKDQGYKIKSATA